MIENFLNHARKTRNDYTARINLLSPYSLIATFLGSGLFIPAPGFWGSVMGAFAAWVISVSLGFYGVLGGFLVIVASGFWAIGEVEKRSDLSDSGVVVIDEVAAVFFMMLFVSFYDLSIFYVVIGFFLFRLFDSFKPWPISWCDENIPGALGVMLDDMIAAVMTLISLYILWMVT